MCLDFGLCCHLFSDPWADTLWFHDWKLLIEFFHDLPAEPSPLHTTTIVEKCTLKLVDEYKHMLCQATEPLSTFLEYIT